MSGMRFGCQTYTWQMSGERYLGELDRIMGVAADAGFEGLECETQFLGKLRDPARMKDALAAAAIDFAALTVVFRWNGATETAEEAAEADFSIDFLAKNFPDTILNICPLTGSDRSNLAERQQNHLTIVNAIARRAADRGVEATYHPNSEPGSTCVTADDYAVMLNGLDAEVVGWCPDIYHIRGGDMDPVETMTTYRSLINHIHYSDLDSALTPQAMGEGDMDFASATRYLRESGYTGWLVVEDHCQRATHDPDGVTRDNGRFFHAHIAPLISA